MVQLAFPVDETVLAVLAALSLPHILYAYCWTCSNSFIKIAKSLKELPMELFYRCAVFLKFVQFGAIGAFMYLKFPQANPLKEVPPPLLALGLALLFFGQTLNAGVYKALGKAGVYYGCKFGHKIPWCHGFPFDTVSHPQYVGCVLSIWGVVALLSLQAYINAGLLTVASVWTVFYFITGIIEQYL